MGRVDETDVMGRFCACDRLNGRAVGGEKGEPMKAAGLTIRHVTQKKGKKKEEKKRAIYLQETWRSTVSRTLFVTLGGDGRVEQNPAVSDMDDAVVYQALRQPDRQKDRERQCPSRGELGASNHESVQSAVKFWEKSPWVISLCSSSNIRPAVTCWVILCFRCPAEAV